MAEKKKRPHELNDPANKETRWIEKAHTQELNIPKSKTEAKVRAKIHRETSELRERKREGGKVHEHAYELPISISNTKTSKTKQAHNFANRKVTRTKMK